MTQQINDIMERASQSLAAMEYLAGERDCLEALALARSQQDWRMYAAIILPLQECRRQRRMTAADGWVRLGSTTLSDLSTLLEQGPGCIVLSYPHNSLDALRLTQAAAQGEHYLEVLYADNHASADTWTLLSPSGAMVVMDIPAPPAAWRDRVLSQNEPWPGEQPRKGIAPRPSDWFIDATEALGDAALRTVKAPLGTLEHLEQLEQCILAVTDHEILHQRLADAARALARTQA